MVSAVCRAVVLARSPGVKMASAAAVSSRTMARFMRWPAAKLSSAVSSSTWSVVGAGEQGLDLGGVEDARPRGRGAGWR